MKKISHGNEILFNYDSSKKTKKIFSCAATAQTPFGIGIVTPMHEFDFLPFYHKIKPKKYLDAVENLLHQTIV